MSKREDSARTLERACDRHKGGRQATIGNARLVCLTVNKIRPLPNEHATARGRHGTSTVSPAVVAPVITPATSKEHP